MILSAHMTDTPERVSKYRESVPPALEQLVMKCLERKAADRWQTAEELLPLLEALATPSGGLTPTGTQPVRGLFLRKQSQVLLTAAAVVVLLLVVGITMMREPRRADTAVINANVVAVLYFENLLRDTAEQYLVDGLTEDVATSLGRVGRVQVKAPSAVRRAQQVGEADLLAIGRSLGVRYVVEGSVRRIVSGLRVSAQLVEPASEVVVWANQYDVERNEVLELPGEIARDVASAVTGGLDPAERASLASRPTRDYEAYDAYLLGNFRFARRTRSMLELALESYRRAVQFDPAFSAARARIAMCYAQMVDYGWLREGETKENLVALGLATADSVLDHDPGSADAWVARGYLLEVGRRLNEAREAQETAISINPQSAEAHNRLSWVLSYLRLYSLAEAEARTAMRLDPGWHIPYRCLGQLAYHTRRYGEAIALLDSAVALAPGYGMSYSWRARVRIAMGDTAGARDDETTLRGLDTPDQWAVTRALVDAATGRRMEALRTVDSLVQTDSTIFDEAAMVLVVLGEHERALTLLESLAQSGGEIDLRAPEFDPIRDDPRFQALLEERN
jgi:TolB-like protein